MTGWQFFRASIGAFVGQFRALLKATGLWWVLTTLLALVVSYVLTDTWGSAATLRPDEEGQYPDLLATFLMVSLVINLVSIGLVAAVALPILNGATPPRSVLPFPSRTDLVQTIWAFVLTGLLVAIGTTVVSALLGQLLPRVPLGVGFVLLPVATAISFWVLWLLLLRVFLQPVDFSVDPEKRVGVFGAVLVAILMCAISLALFLGATAAVFSTLSEAIVTSILGWILLMLALSTVAVRVTRDE